MISISECGNYAECDDNEKLIIEWMQFSSVVKFSVKAPGGDTANVSTMDPEEVIEMKMKVADFKLLMDLMSETDQRGRELLRAAEGK